MTTNRRLEVVTIVCVPSSGVMISVVVVANQQLEKNVSREAADRCLQSERQSTIGRLRVSIWFQ